MGILGLICLCTVLQGASRADPLSALLVRQEHVAAFAWAADELGRAAAEGERSPATLQALHDLGTVAHLGGNQALAVELLERAVRGRREVLGPCHPDVAESLYRLGTAYRYLERRTESWDCYEEALAILAEHPECAALRARVLQIRAHWLRGAGYEQALPAFREALAATRAATPGPSLDLANAATWLGWTLCQAGETADAVPLLDEAEAALLALGLEAHELMGVILGLRGTSAAIAGRLEEAAASFGRAGAILEDVRANHLPGFPRKHAPLEVFTAQAWALAELGRGEEAWWAMQRARSNAAEDFVLLGDWPERDPDGYREATVLRRRYLQADPAGGELDALVQRVQCLARLYALEKAYGEAHALPLPSPEEVGRRLAPGTAWVGRLDLQLGSDPRRPRRVLRSSRWIYVLGHDRPLRWVRAFEGHTPEEFLAVRAPEKELADLLTRAAGWPYRVQRDPLLERLARTVARCWFDPLEPQLDGVDHLLLEDVGQHPPLSVLRDRDGRSLAERYVISCTPSAASFLRLEAAAGTALEPALVLGGPSAPSEAAALPHAGEEIGRFLDTWSGTGLNRVESRAGLRPLALADELAAFGLLHLVGHWRADPSPPDCGLWIASGEAGAAECLRSEEILCSWRLEHPLVVLSGCRSANGAGHFRGESFGMLQTMLGVGARAVVGSRWEVDDWATSLLMREFYRRLKQREDADGPHATVAEALAESKRWLARTTDENGRRPFEHPVYWAAFELIGATD